MERGKLAAEGQPMSSSSSRRSAAARPTTRLGNGLVDWHAEGPKSGCIQPSKP